TEALPGRVVEPAGRARRPAQLGAARPAEPEAARVLGAARRAGDHRLARRPPVQDRALLYRHQVAPVLAVGALDRLPGLSTGVVELAAQADHLLLQLHHQLHARQVQAGAGEALDAAQALDVAVAVATAAAAGAGGIEQSPPLVDA